MFEDWAGAALDTFGNMRRIASDAFEGISNSLTDLVMTGKADFNSLATSILRDITQMIIKAQMAQILMSAFGITAAPPMVPQPVYQVPSPVGKVPSGQYGGTVAKTGLAVIHEGEILSGVPQEGRREVVFNFNVNAIDAQGTYQFLDKSKRMIAAMLGGELDDNNPLRKKVRRG